MAEQKAAFIFSTGVVHQTNNKIQTFLCVGGPNDELCTVKFVALHKRTYMHRELWFCPQVKNFCAKVLNLRAQSTATDTAI